jgi:predicted MFS family arabinose efflux permease
MAVLLIVFFLREERGAPVPSSANAADRRGAPLSSNFWRVIFAIALFSLANSSDAFLLLQANKAGVAASMLPLLWAAHHVVKSLFSTHAGALSDRSRRVNFLALGWVLYALTYSLFPAANTLPLFFALFVLYAFPFTLTEGAERALIAESVAADSRGRGFGIYYLVTGLGVLAGSTLFGFLYQRVSPSAAFTTGAGLALAAAAVIVVSSRGR